MTQIENLRLEAKERFLRDDKVVGVAESMDKPAGLIFLVRSESEPVRRSIQDWAHDRHIHVRFRVVGEFKASGA